MSFEPKDQKSEIEDLIAQIDTFKSIDAVISDSKKAIDDHTNLQKEPTGSGVVDEAIFDELKYGKNGAPPAEENKSALRRLWDEEEDDNEEGEEPPVRMPIYDDMDQEDIEDFESEDERDEIYRDLKNTVSKMAVKSIAFFLLSLVAVIAFLIGLRGGVFGLTGESIWFHLILLAVDLACVFLSFGIFSQGLARLLRLRADTDTLLAMLFIALTAVRILSVMIPSLRSYPLYLEPMLAIGLYFNVLAKKKIASNIKKNFRILAASGHKLTATMQPDLEVKNELILETGEGGDVLFAHGTELVSKFIDHSYSDYECDHRFYRIHFLSVVLILAGTVAVWQLTGWREAVYFPAAALALSIPFFSRYYYASSIYKNGQKIRKNGGVLTSVASAKELEDSDLLMISEEDFLGENAVLLQGVKALGALQIDDLITYIAALYSCVGTPLKPLFLKMIDAKSVVLPGVLNPSYQKGYGYSCMINSREFAVGSAEYMRELKVEFPKQFSNMQLKPCHFPVYVAYNHEPAGIFIASFESNLQTKQAIEFAIDEQLSVGLVSNNYLFDETLLRSLYPMIDMSLFHFISYNTGEACRSYLEKKEKSPDLIASRTGLQGLAACLYGCSKLLTAIKINRIIRLLYMLLSIGLIFFIALAGYSDDTAMQILVFQWIWTAVVWLVCTFCK